MVRISKQTGYGADLVSEGQARCSICGVYFDDPHKEAGHMILTGHMMSPFWKAVWEGAKTHKPKEVRKILEYWWKEAL